MTNALLEGPGRTLECIHPKFMVDLVQGEEPKRADGTLQQQQFRERLTQEILSQTQLRAWAMAGMFSEHLMMRLKLVEKLAGMLDPGHLALTRIAARLQVLQQTDLSRTVRPRTGSATYHPQRVVSPAQCLEGEGAEPAWSHGSGRGTQ